MRDQKKTSLSPSITGNRVDKIPLEICVGSTYTVTMKILNSLMKEEEKIIKKIQKSLKKCLESPKNKENDPEGFLKSTERNCNTSFGSKSTHNTF